MNNSKLILLLRTFSKAELKEFEKLVASPYFNRGRNHISFLKELKKFYPKFDDKKLTAEYIFSKIHPGKKFNKQIIWNTTSSLQNMAEDFLTQVFLKKNGFIKNTHINDELYQRKLSNLYSKNLDNLAKELDKIGITGHYFQFRGDLESGRIRYHFLEDQQHLVHAHVVKKGEYSVLNFLRNISGVINDMRSNVRMFNAKFDINIPYEFINNLHLDKIISYARKNRYSYLNIMEMYYCSIMMAISPLETSFFFRLKELFEKNSGKFETEEKKNWLTLLANYCSDKINEGADRYRKTLFEVNKLQLKEIEKFPSLDLGKILYIQTLRNALSMNEIKWAKAYIEKYTYYLKRSYQKSMHAMANAFLFFKLKEYNKVIENLGKVRFIDIRDKFLVRSLYIRTYYELGEFPALLYQIDSAKQFIMKNINIAKHTRKNFNIFLMYMSRFLRFVETNDTYQIEVLKKSVEQDKPLVNGEWLLEKIEEFKKQPALK